jgi:uncharacterized membrane protein YeaQ/YmgE (transglycosylase-associated protein family)
VDAASRDIARPYGHTFIASGSAFRAARSLLEVAPPGTALGFRERSQSRPVDSRRSATPKGNAMFVSAWILLGLLSGFISGLLANASGTGIVLDFVLGTIGATGGGFFFTILGEEDVDDFRLWSLLGAAIGAVAILVVAHAAAARDRGHVRASRTPGSPIPARRDRLLDRAPVLRIRPSEFRSGRWLEP